MKVTKIKLLGADNRYKTITLNKEIDNAIGFIKKSEFSDYMVVHSEIIDLGELYDIREIGNEIKLLSTSVLMECKKH